MAILIPNYLQTGSYAAKKDRRVNSAEVLQEGIVRRGHYALAQRGAGANMSVDVAAGEAWVKGDSAADQGYYHVVNDATVNVGLSAANGTNPRIDAIVLAVNDSTEVGGSDSYLLEAIAGTPTAAATLANLKGAPNGVSGPTIGATKLLLGYVLVAAAATKVETAAMGGLRDPKTYNAELGTTKAEPYAIAGAPAQYAHGRPLDWIPGAAAARTAGQVTSNGIGALMEWTSETMDTEEIHSIASETSKFVIKTPGFYNLSCSLLYGTPSTQAYIIPQVNGAATIGEAGWINCGNAIVSNLSTSFMYRLGYGDYVTWTAQQSTGSVSVAGYTALAWQGP